VRSSTDNINSNKLLINCYDSRPISQLSGGVKSSNLENGGQNLYRNNNSQSN